MPSQKKIARRQVRRVNGKLKVVYVDVATGEEITNLDGYEISSGDGFAGAPVLPSSGGDTTSPQPSYSGGGGTETGDPFVPDGIRGKGSVGSGNIIEDFKKAGSNLNRSILDAKQSAINAGIELVGGKTTTTPVGQPTDMSFEALQSQYGGGAYKPPANGAYSPARWDRGTKEGVDPRLMDIINEAALRSPYQVELISGNDSRDSAPSKGGSRHPKGQAIDIVLRDPDTGEEIPNYQNAESFRVYEQFAQTARTVQTNKYPELDSKFVWGGYFMNGGPGKYGNMDSMHFDIGTGQMGAGSWEAGLTSAVMLKAYPTIKSEGMGTDKWPLTPPGESPVPEIRLAKEAMATAQEVPGTTGGLTPGAQEALNKGLGNNSYSKMLGTGLVNKELEQAILGIQDTAAKAWGADVLPAGKPGIIDPSAVNAVKATFDDGFREPKPGEITPWNQITRAGEEALPHDLGPKMPWHTDPPGDEMAQVGPMSKAPAGFDYTVPKLSTPSPFVKQPGTMTATEAAYAMSAVDPYQYIKDAYLAQIAKAEDGAPNRLFGGREIDDLSDHPGEKVYYNNGKDYSTAAGLLQITEPTWREYAAKAGVTDFTEESQKRVGWEIASANYQAKTGRDLLNDLVEGNETAITSAYTMNANRWASLPGGKQPRSDINTLVQGYIRDAAEGKLAMSAAQANQAAMGFEDNSLPNMSIATPGIGDDIRARAKATATKEAANVGSSFVPGVGAAKTAATSKAGSIAGSMIPGVGSITSSAGDAFKPSTTTTSSKGTTTTTSNKSTISAGGSTTSPGTAFASPSGKVTGTASATASTGVKASGSGTVSFASKPSASTISANTTSKNNANGR
jgi:muramidase (phage lysozyme)